jgi:DNA polymerase V
MKVIPLKIKAGISGLELPAVEYTELDLTLNQLLIENPDATFIGRASGNSMVDVGIFDGDLLIIDRKVEITQNSVIVANYNGGFVCKLLNINKRELVSASKDYDAVYISPNDEFQIEGVVTKSVRLHRPAPELT